MTPELGIVGYPPRDLLLKKHAQELRKHMSLLASKEYWRHIPATADFVVMFVPGEASLAEAYRVRPALFDEAAARGIGVRASAELLGVLMP